jgi:alkylhydroperoxidase family enzyme
LAIIKRDSSQPTTAENTALREALVIGEAPRIGPLPVEALTEDLLMILQRMERVNSALESRGRADTENLLADHAAGVGGIGSSQLAVISEIVLTMLRHPKLFAHQADLGIQLLSQGALVPRDRELVILRMAWLCQAPYEWGEHVLIAKRVGVSSDEVQRITEGSAAAGWSEYDQALMRATEELHENAFITDTTWATLSVRLDERQLIELPILIGQYQTVAYYQNSLRLRLEDGNIGLAAR